MMFTEQLAVAIVKGEKTQTRRRVSPKPRSPWREPGGMAHHRVWTYPVGKVFTVNPGRGVHRVAECEVTARRIAKLGDMTVEQGRAEGYPLTAKAGFIAVWQQINGSWSADTRVHVVEFKLVGPDCSACHGNGGAMDLDPVVLGCRFCFGTGVEVSGDARALIYRRRKEYREKFKRELCMYCRDRGAPGYKDRVGRIGCWHCQCGTITSHNPIFI